jgi:hypothetical protein
MVSVREQVIVAVIDALNTGSPIVVSQRTRRRDYGETATLLAMNVKPVRSVVEEVGKPGSPLTREFLTLEIEMVAVGTATDRPDTVVDQLYVDMIARLVGNNLGGLVHRISEGDSEWTFPEVGDYANVVLTTQLIVSFQHLAADATLRT